MIKKIIKELAIFLLLAVAIILIFTVLFYDSNPINKVIPDTVSYTRPEPLKEELEKTVDEVKPTIVTYKIEQEHLTQYEKNDSYNPGKIDPFGSYDGEESTPSTNVGSGSKSSGSSATSSTTGNNTSKEETNTQVSTTVGTGGSGNSTSVVNK